MHKVYFSNEEENIKLQIIHMNTLFSGKVQKYFELLLPRNMSVAINRMNFKK